jgi:zinc transport system substrate-binding protein
MFGKKVGLLLTSLLVASIVTACGTAKPSATQEKTDSQDKVSVYTTIYPLQYVASRIGGQWAEVKNVVPLGVEPHDFEPSAQDMVALSQADLFVYNGAGLEAWVEKAVEGFDKSKVTVVNATDGLTLLEAAEEHEEHEGEATTESKEHEHEHGQFDPHVWMDPTLLKQQAAKVKDAMVKIDQAHSADYEKHYEQLAADLDALDKEYQAMVAKAKRKEFMVSHSAFSYLAHRYGIEQLAISGISPADEPSPAELKELVEHVKEHNISYVLFETLVSPKVAEVIAREAGVKTAMLNPLEGLTEEEAKAGKDYLAIMRENLETLRVALQ